MLYFVIVVKALLCLTDKFKLHHIYICKAKYISYLGFSTTCGFSSTHWESLNISPANTRGLPHSTGKRESGSKPNVKVQWP